MFWTSASCPVLQWRELGEPEDGRSTTYSHRDRAERGLVKIITNETLCVLQVCCMNVWRSPAKIYLLEVTCYLINCQINVN